MAISKLKALFFIALALVVFAPIFSNAAIEITETDINVNTVPEDPAPYSDVTITLSSYAADLNKSFIEWKSGNKTILSGYGKTTYSFKALGANSPTVFTINISIGSKQIIKNVVINPSEVDMLWQGVGGYVPPFYRGRSHASPEGFIKVVAIPNTNGTRANKNKLSYTWRQNDKTVLPNSGYGKDAYVFTNNSLNASEDISVSASSLDGTYNGSGSINVPIIDPFMIFYKKSPTDGILYNKALVGETIMNEDEMTVVAAPYFLTWNYNSNYDYKWKINGEGISTPKEINQVTIRPVSRGGYATIEFSIENLNKLFQKVGSILKLNI